jgi:hypothetical protein
MISVKKVGGFHFLKIGRLQFMFCRTRSNAPLKGGRLVSFLPTGLVIIGFANLLAGGPEGLSGIVIGAGALLGGKA